jgi:arylsulfatase A-like enzyme
MIDLESRLTAAEVAGRERGWVLHQAGHQVRLNDVVYRTLPASPPSRLQLSLDVPPGARLETACAIAPRFHNQPGVEFRIKLRRGEDEHVLWTRLIDPIQKPEDRHWVPVELDLSAYAGPGAELVFETSGYEERGDVRRAFWGAPAVVTRHAAEAPLVVLYLVDTLRADHTTPYGYARDTTPALAAFGRDAVVFDAAIAHASWTKPSVASIFTSLLPGRHRAVQLRDKLDPGLVTLAEMLQTKGYTTGAAIANSVIYSDGTHFEQGFDFYAGLHGADDRPSKLVDAADVVDTALAWIDSRPGLPQLVYVHTMDPHVPYAPPEPFDRKYEPPPAPGRTASDPRYDYQEPADRERLIAQYDGAVAYGDREFGRFVSELKRRGLYDRALFVFLADHGEEFQDHGGWLHGRTVFDELIRVPLIVKFPGQRDAGTRVAQQVQLVDILPTVLRNEGLPVPDSPIITGHPLQDVLRGGAPEPPAVSEISHRGFVAHGMRTGRDKYVHRFSPDEDELYFDLVRDPKEQDSRLDENRERVRFLRAGVEAAMVPNPFRYTLRFAGSGRYELRLRTGGWVEGVEAVGFGSSERYEVEANGRRLVLSAEPRPGQPREVTFGVRPQGAPVRLEGTRDGRPLRPSDVLIAREAVHPAAVPFALPEIETEAERVEDIFSAPPAGRPGLQVWLAMAPGHSVLEFDAATRERLKALGYIN